MALFLATFNTQETYFPGTDGMIRKPSVDNLRLVESDSEDGAKQVVLENYEKNIPYDLRVDVTNLVVSAVLKKI